MPKPRARGIRRRGQSTAATIGVALLVLSSLTGSLSGVSAAQDGSDPLPTTTFGCPANGTNPTNPYTYRVPPGVTSLDVLVKGARGGNGQATGDGASAQGGNGAVVSVSLTSLVPGEQLQVYVGCGNLGYRSGGRGGNGYDATVANGYDGGSGGGSSALVSGGGTLVVEAAGGGGGSGDSNVGFDGGNGGVGGARGTAGGKGNDDYSNGGGGGVVEGGGGAEGQSFVNGWVGTSGGGGGGAGCSVRVGGTGGGGGGGGAGQSFTNATGAGGGGGSSCVRDEFPTRYETVSASTITDGGNGGQGQVVIQPDLISLTSVSSTVVDVNGSAEDDAGDAIDYTYVVRNAGASTVGSVAITTVLTAPAQTAPVVTCVGTPVLPGGTATCTGRYDVKIADVDQANVRTTASASAVSALGAPLTTAGTAHDTALDRRPELTITGGGTIADQGRPVRPGDPVSITFTVENTGNTSAPVGLDVYEGDPITAKTPAVCPDGTGRLTLDPGQEGTCTSTYPLSQADIDRGGVAVDIDAFGQVVPLGAVIRGELGFTVPVAQSSGVTATGTATLVDVGPDGLYRPGDRIDYAITTTNTGNTTLHGISIVGDVVGKGDTTISLTGCPNTGGTTLEASATLLCTGSYTLAQGDVDEGRVSYNPVVSATTPAGAVLPPVAVALTTELPKVDSVDLTARVRGVDDRNDNGKNDANDVVTYEVVVTNTGTTTLEDIALYDMLGDSVLDFGCTPEVGAAMAPGATSTCTARYTIRPEDAGAGSLAYTPTLSGDSPVVTTKSNTVEIPVVQSALMSVEVSTADLSDGNQDGVVGGTGDDVEFRILVRNTGFVALTDVVVTASSASPAGTLPPLVCTPPLSGGLATGAQSLCTATYRITGADAASGKVVVDATSSATGPAGEAVASRNSTTVAVKAAPVVGTTTAPPTTTTTESPSSSAPASSSTPASTSKSTSASRSTSASAPKSSAAAAGAVSTPTTPLASTGASVRGITVIALAALLLGSVALLSLRGKRRSGN